MRFLVTIQHPAHVHFFRPIIAELRDAGHRVSVYAREKDVAVRLLDAFAIDHEVLVGGADSLPGLAAVQARWEWRLLRAARRERPDVLTGIGGIAAAHVAAAIGARSVVFTDTETPANWLAAPLADAVCTPRAFGQDLGGGHHRYDGFQELAYLHPDRFDPDPDALRAAGVDPDEPFSVCRFSDLAAHHDVGASGLGPADRRELVATLRQHGPVYVSDEGDGALPPGAEPLPVAAHHLHDLLAAADLLVTDAGTTATEAGLLGTPTVRVGAFGGDHLRNFVELERYGLVRSTPDRAEAMALARTLAADRDAGTVWAGRRERLLADSVDVASFAASALVRVGESGTVPADAGVADATAADAGTADAGSAGVDSTETDAAENGAADTAHTGTVETDARDDAQEVGLGG